MSMPTTQSTEEDTTSQAHSYSDQSLAMESDGAMNAPLTDFSGNAVEVEGASVVQDDPFAGDSTTQQSIMQPQCSSHGNALPTWLFADDQLDVAQNNAPYNQLQSSNALPGGQAPLAHSNIPLAYWDASTIPHAHAGMATNDIAATAYGLSNNAPLVPATFDDPNSYSQTTQAVIQQQHLSNLSIVPQAPAPWQQMPATPFYGSAMPFMGYINPAGSMMAPQAAIPTFPYLPMQPSHALPSPQFPLTSSAITSQPVSTFNYSNVPAEPVNVQSDSERATTNASQGTNPDVSNQDSEVDAPRAGQPQPSTPQKTPRKHWIRFSNGGQGKTPRHNKLSQYDADAFYERQENCNTWTASLGPDRSINFCYNLYGELVDEQQQDRLRTFSPEELRAFILKHDRVNAAQYGKLTLFVQRTPADSARRYANETSNQCRLSCCPLRQVGQVAVLRAGHLRVAMDEKWEKHARKANPIHVAGYVHLYCLEHFMSLPELCRKVRFEMDQRCFPDTEPGGKWGATYTGSQSTIGDVAQEYLKEIRRYRRTDARQTRQFNQHVSNAGTLTELMMSMMVETLTPSKKKQLKERGSDTDMLVLKGCLNQYVKMKWPKKYQRNIDPSFDAAGLLDEQAQKAQSSTSSKRKRGEEDEQEEEEEEELESPLKRARLAARLAAGSGSTADFEEETTSESQSEAENPASDGPEAVSGADPEANPITGAEDVTEVTDTVALVDRLIAGAERGPGGDSGSQDPVSSEDDANVELDTLLGFGRGWGDPDP